jgi:DNA-binding transcriptional LysR family regulator
VRALRDLPLISLPRGTGLRVLLDDACAAAGFRPRIALEAGDPTVLARLAARGLGIAIVPASLAASRADELHAIPITRPELRGALALAWRAGGPASPAGRALVAEALELVYQR